MKQRPTSYIRVNANPSITICQLSSRIFLARSALVLLFFLSLPTFLFSQAQAVPPGASYELGFSPGGTSLSVVLDAINSAKTSLLVAAYEFTSRPIADALVRASHRVHVAIVADYKASLQRYSLIPFLEKSGIPVRRDSRHAISHDKYLVIDGVSVELGSYNFTAAATSSNAENALVLWNVPEIAARYTQDWQSLWNESK